MRVLVACEFSGRVRDAFSRRGHDAWSCDLLTSSKPGNHIEGDVRKVLRDGWDLMIAHPPCTHLAVSGARWFKEKRKKQIKALEFFLELLNAPIPMICVENPIGVISTRICKPDQIIQPWMFDEPECKATCLWLRRLPRLQQTKVIPDKLRNTSVFLEPPSDNRWMLRSITPFGIAKAMAEQWGVLEPYKWDLQMCERRKFNHKIKY